MVYYFFDVVSVLVLYPDQDICGECFPKPDAV